MNDKEAAFRAVWKEITKDYPPARWLLPSKGSVNHRLFMKAFDAGRASAEAEIERPVRGQCRWKQIDPEWSNTFETDCDEAFVLDDGFPLENGMRFCCFCGADLIEVPFTDTAEALAAETEGK